MIDVPRAPATVRAAYAHLLACAMALTLSFGCASSAAAQTPQEYQIKAVFLFNFAQFVEWPAEAFEAPDQPISICILGQDPFGGFLDETVRDEKVGERALVIRRYQRVEEAGACQILYVSHSEREDVRDIFAFLKGRSILTVSDADAFASKGGMIRFLTRNNRINLRINVEAAEAAGLKISSKLLRPAEIMTSEAE